MHGRGRAGVAAVALILIAGLVAACGGGGGSGSGAASSGGGKGTTINIGYFPVVSPVPIMQEQQQLEKAGYKVNWVPVSTGLPGAASALAAGKLDMTWGNSDSGVIIFSQSPDAAVFVGQSFVNENITVVSNRSGITSTKQLANRKVVVSGLKTASTLFYQLGLRKAGIDPKSDKYFVSGTGPGMVGVLASGSADVAAGYVPYSAQMVIKHTGHVLFTANDALGMPAPGDGFIASRKFAQAHPDAVQAVLKAQFAATDYIKDHPDQAYKTLASFAKVDEAAVKYSFEHGMISVASTYVPDASGIEKVSKLAQQNGFAPQGVDLGAFARKFVDTSYAQKASGAGQ